MTWEQAVQWLRQQPDQADLVRDCYFDDPLETAAERYAASPEWRALEALLPGAPGLALDLGAGRGISSYALARAGWRVTALEPDPSDLVGNGAIAGLADASRLAIFPISSYAERLPFPDNAFDLVLARQILHHAHDLTLLCAEAARVLKPGGCLIATREHVISRQADLGVFLAAHPLQRLYGGENAFLLKDYLSAIRCERVAPYRGKMRVFRVMGPLDSPINYAPMTFTAWRALCSRPLQMVLGRRGANWLIAHERVGGALLKWQANLISRLSNSPGRLYSFFARRV